MNKTDLEYGKVLVTGEISFYMHHPKSRRVTIESKSKFINRWIKERLKTKRDTSDVRKVLQKVRSEKKPSIMWDRNVRAYLSHVSNCKKIKELGKTDRDLIDEIVREMNGLGIHAKTGINPKTSISDEEAEKFGKNGAFLMLDISEKSFDNGTLKSGYNVDFIATNNNVVATATNLFLKRSFPLKCADKQDIFCVGSAEGQVNTTLASIRR